MTSTQEKPFYSEVVKASIASPIAETTEEAVMNRAMEMDLPSSPEKQKKKRVKPTPVHKEINVGLLKKQHAQYKSKLLAVSRQIKQLKALDETIKQMLEQTE